LKGGEEPFDLLSLQAPFKTVNPTSF